MAPSLDEETLPLGEFTRLFIARVRRIALQGGKFKYSNEPLPDGRIKLAMSSHLGQLIAYVAPPLSPPFVGIKSGNLGTTRARALMERWVKFLSNLPNNEP